MSKWICAGLVGVLLACSPAAQTDNASSDISAEELLGRIAATAPPLILDVRTPGEFQAGHVPGAINIPHEEVSARLAELGAPGAGDVVVYCESGRRAGMAADVLQEAGFSVLHLAGDMSEWRSASRPVE